ncbi:hypothetical protein IW140_000135 [Coemansia sp. RSA 1813]|nr:hypothetical protein EV178_000060 [Coemansia sp. RSA 1646]KAJ1772300.1 hypothetical protein LPJ74_001565 [Coemansia sp. RSA 1843]KAJ2093241.1 hypothetical protein IW138_000534 [Coemansia sp. RSA 986]KAJ2217495.1 hypothetical protein EV179_000329 [Coemansia sp. RSA 487]KAJ2573493.1 hypothetical protein IW140_000135 [Coemansia sp. RSA 1813]
MGISGLLPLLRETQRKGHVKEFSGQTVGVDSYIWLYKGAFACASDLAMDRPTTKYITFFMNRARMLRHHGVEPYFVFDGGLLPSKQKTEQERSGNRELRRKQGIELWNKGKRKEAFEMFQRCVEATPEMARAVVQELRAEGFQYLVAPYEADAQLAFLETQGIISAVISEDSDLIVFGCRNIIFKLDQYGAAVVFDRRRIDKTKTVKIAGWDNHKLRQMCILSGCDYAASVPRVGLKTAYQYTARSTDIRMAISLMRAEGLSVPDGYEDDAVRADLTFRYQHVYDPRTKTMVHVTQPDGDSPLVDDMPFIGALLEPAIVHAVAMCELDPLSYLPFDKSTASSTKSFLIDFEKLSAARASSFSTPDSSKASSSSPPASAKASPSSSMPDSAKTASSSSSLANAKAASRSRSLHSFWVRPSPKFFKPMAPSVSNSTVASATMAAADAQISKEDTTSEPESLDEGIVTRFRSKNAAHSTVMPTGKQSRFFANRPTPASASSPASAPAPAPALASVSALALASTSASASVSAEPSECVEDSQSSAAATTETQLTETQLTELSQLNSNEAESSASVSPTTYQAKMELSQASTVVCGLDLSSSQLGAAVHPQTESPENAEPSHNDHSPQKHREGGGLHKRKFNLFDSLQNKVTELPKWAAMPVYKKGK